MRASEKFTLTGDRTGILFLKQVHGNQIVEVTREGDALLPSGIEQDRAIEGDGMITTVPDVLIGVRVADCLPVVFLSPGKGIAGIVHAGWRSTCARIAQRFLEVGMRNCQAKPEDFWVGLGPAIGPCCYPVGEEVRDRFASEFSDWEEYFSVHPDGTLRLNLRNANVLQLRAAGIPPDQIADLPLCTSCRSDLFHSARRDGKGGGRQVAFAGLGGAVAKERVL